MMKDERKFPLYCVLCSIATSDRVIAEFIIYGQSICGKQLHITLVEEAEGNVNQIAYNDALYEGEG